MLWSRLRHWAGGSRAERDLAEEMRLHRVALEEQFRAEGLSPGAARTAAARRFGNSTLAAEESREQWQVPWIAGMIQDLRFAWRLARRQPLFTAAAVLTIALGVGANTTIMSVLQTLLVNPAGLRAADRIGIARVRIDKIGMRHVQASAVEYREIQTMTDAFSVVAATEEWFWASQTPEGPVRLRGQSVTPDFFGLFGVSPHLGRMLARGETDGAVLSHALWKSQFGADPAVIGRTLRLDNKPYRIVGVAPAGFRFPAKTQLWVPLVLDQKRLSARGYDMSLWVFARLKDGVSMVQASDFVRRYTEGLVSTAEGRQLAELGYGVEFDPLVDFVVGDLRRPLWLLSASALLVLLIGCANVAGLLLSRTAGRRREIAIRISLGASRYQIVRQLLTESLLSGALGGVCGLCIARGVVPFVAQLNVSGSRWLTLVELDGRALAFGLALSLASGLLFGLTPALQLVRESHASRMVRHRRHRFQDIFVVAQVGGAFVLVAATLLLLRSLWVLHNINPGFAADHLTTAYVLKPSNDPGFLDRLRAELRSAPDTKTAALAAPVPFDGGGFASFFQIRGRERAPTEPQLHGTAYLVSPEYFSTMRIPLIRGRNLDDGDKASSPLVCLIDARLAESHFPKQDPIGQEILMYSRWARVVGITGAIRDTTLEGDSRPAVYYSLAQLSFPSNIAVVARSPVSAGPAIRSVVRRVNASVPVYDVSPMTDRIGESLGVRRVLAFLLAAFGGIAFTLAAVGIYTVTAQSVSERSQEIGVRIAMGARPPQVRNALLWQGLRNGVIGLACGMVAGAILQRWIAGVLYQVHPFDPVSMLVAGAGMFLVILAAAWWPAVGASRIELARALRAE